MARTSRNNMENSSFFHIMVQGINKEYIFNTRKNKEKYLEYLHKNNIDIKIIAYCIMDNHAHILVQTDNIKNIEIWMKKSNISYAIYYNKKNDRVGYVFRNRYKMQPIKNEKHLYLCIDYIHDNPVKAKNCGKKEEYEFSSYNHLYQGNQTKIQKIIKQALRLSTLQKNENEEIEEEFSFIEDSKKDKEEICKEIIEEFLGKKKLTLQDLKKEKELLKKLIKILKNENDISYRIMEKYLEISRETIRKLIVI